VVPLAEKHFGFDSSKVNVVVSDGRQFLNQSDKQYDAIILDAFLGDSTPSHLMTQEAFTSIREHLSPTGVLVINCFGESTDQRQFFASSLDKTLRSVFVGKHRVTVHASGQGNVFFVATRADKLVKHRPPAAPNAEARERMAALVEDSAIRTEWYTWWQQANGTGPFFSEHSQMQEELGLAWKKERVYDPNVGSILLDDFNPVEFHDAHNREANRRGLMNFIQPTDG
jgi:hypothetical protein